MTDKEQIIIHGVEVLKEKINMCFILLINKLETPETIEQTIYEHLDAFVEEWNTQLIRKTQECEKMKYYLNKIRHEELSNLDIEWDEYITECACTDYSNIITYVEYGLGEINDR